MFEFSTATRIIFGVGSLSKVGAIAAGLGRHALVVGGSSPSRLSPLLNELQAAKVSCDIFSVSGEPSVPLILQGLEKAKSAKCDVVISMGGGSVLDAGKAIAALLTNPDEPLDYLEVVGKGQPLTNPAAPFIAIPTTSGTGSEVTQNAVLSVPEKRVKVSMRSPLMLPKVALIDPALTYSLSAQMTAYTGLDALTQCLEPFVSPFANPLTDGFCREGLRRAATSLRRAYSHPDDATAREAMSVVSLCGGLALANAKLGAVHGFAGPLGGMLEAPHGALCASLLPYVVEANLEALAENSGAFQRYSEVARLLTGSARASAQDSVIWLKELCKDLEIPKLSTLGMKTTDIDEAVSKAKNASSMKGNPVPLSDDALLTILQKAF